MGEMIVQDDAGMPARFGRVALPAVIQDAGEQAQRLFVEFFTARLENHHTREAYARAVGRFLDWADQQGLALRQLEPVAVAAYLEQMKRDGLQVATIKLHMAAIRMLCDHLVTGGVLPFNPASSVRTPRLVLRSGKTPALLEEEARRLLDAMEGDPSLIALRDRALLSIMVYGFVRVSATVALRVRDFEGSQRRAFLFVHEKGGQERRIPLHSKAAHRIDTWLENSGLKEARPETPLFQGFIGRTGQLSGLALTRRQALNIVKRRAKAAGLPVSLRSHSLRATGITAFLLAGGSLEGAAEIAGHVSTRTTQLYDKRLERASAEDVERIRI